MVSVGVRATYLPYTQQFGKNVVRKAAAQHLRHDKDVARESALKHDWHVGSVEQLDGISSTLSANTLALNWDLDPETLQVDHNRENNHCGNKVHDIR
jgi:hypothetical protein